MGRDASSHRQRQKMDFPSDILVSYNTTHEMVSPNHTWRQIHPPEQELKIGGLQKSIVKMKKGKWHPSEIQFQSFGSQFGKWLVGRDWVTKATRWRIKSKCYATTVLCWDCCRRPDLSNDLCSRLKVRINPFTVAFVLSRDVRCLFQFIFIDFQGVFFFLRRIGTIPGIKRTHVRQPSNY